MICVGALNPEIMGKTRYLQAFIEPGETQEVRVNANYNNMFVNGLRILTPVHKVSSVNKVDFLTIMSECSIKLNKLNGIATYGIDRSKDRVVQEYEFTEDDFETLNLDKLAEAHPKFTHEIKDMTMSYIYPKHYIVRPDSFELTLKAEKAIRFKYVFDIPMGKIIFEFHEKPYMHYVRTTDHFGDEIDLYDDYMFDFNAVMNVAFTDFEFKIIYSKEEGTFKTVLILLSEDTEVYAEENVFDATNKIFYTEVFTIESYYENASTFKAKMNFSVKATGTLMTEEESLGSIIIPGYIDTHSKVSFKIDHFDLARKHKNIGTNMLYSAAYRTQDAQKSLYKIEFPHVYEDPKTKIFELNGLEYYFYSWSNYYTKADFRIESFFFNNLRSLIITDLFITDVDAQDIISSQIVADGTSPSLLARLTNNTNVRQHILYNRSSKSGNLQDLNQTMNMFSRVNDTARHIMSSIRYKPTSIYFEGLALIMAETGSVNPVSNSFLSNYEAWNDPSNIQKEHLVTEKDFSLIFFQNTGKFYHIKGIIKPLINKSDVDLHKGLIIYGYRLIMNVNKQEVSFCQTMFREPMIYLANSYIPFDLKIELHGGV